MRSRLLSWRSLLPDSIVARLRMRLRKDLAFRLFAVFGCGIFAWKLAGYQKNFRFDS